MLLIKDHVQPSTICKPLHEVMYCAAKLLGIIKIQVFAIIQGVRAQAQNTYFKRSTYNAFTNHRMEKQL